MYSFCPENPETAPGNTMPKALQFFKLLRSRGAEEVLRKHTDKVLVKPRTSSFYAQLGCSSCQAACSSPEWQSWWFREENLSSRPSVTPAAMDQQNVLQEAELRDAIVTSAQFHFLLSIRAQADIEGLKAFQPADSDAHISTPERGHFVPELLSHMIMLQSLAPSPIAKVMAFSSFHLYLCQSLSTPA